MPKSIVPSLARIRKVRGFSQQALAEAVGVTAMSISNYESGRNAPSPKVMLELAKTLRVSLDRLVAP